MKWKAIENHQKTQKTLFLCGPRFLNRASRVFVHFVRWIGPFLAAQGSQESPYLAPVIRRLAVTSWVEMLREGGLKVRNVDMWICGYLDLRIGEFDCSFLSCTDAPMLRDVHALVPVWASRLGTLKWVLPSKGSRYTFLHCIHRKISHETWNVRFEQKPTGTRKMKGCPVFLSCLTSKSKNSGRAGRNLNFKLLHYGFWILHFVHAFAVLKFWKFGFCILGRDIECNMWVPPTPLDFWHAEFGSEDIGYYSWYRLNDSTFI